MTYNYVSEDFNLVSPIYTCPVIIYLQTFPIECPALVLCGFFHLFFSTVLSRMLAISDTWLVST